MRSQTFHHLLYIPFHFYWAFSHFVPPLISNTLLNNLFKSEDETSLRLKKLNELYEEKLISEEEYNSKRKEIIDSL